MLIRLLQSPWTATLLGTVVYLATILLVWRPQGLTGVSNAAENVPAGPSWTFQNPEVDLLIEELKREKESLAARAKELQELAARLDSERNELTLLTQAVAQVQAEFDSHVTRVRQEESANLKKLAKLYAAMTPQNAASVFKALDEATLVKILTFMKETETAPVLDVLAKQSDTEAKRVAALSERLRLALPDQKKILTP